MKENSITIIHETIQEEQKAQIQKFIQYFFDELDLTCYLNKIDNFHEWFLERTFLSIYLNGIIRNDKERNASVIQEFSVKNKENDTNGRCDAMLTKNKTIFLIESKFQNKSEPNSKSHWDIESWTKYDNKNFDQLKRYYNVDENFYSIEKRYCKVFLQTLDFKIIKAEMNKHISDAKEKLKIDKENLDERGWFYSCYFPKYLKSENDTIGIEVYGSIKEI